MKDRVPKKLLKQPTDLMKDGMSDLNSSNEAAHEEIEKMSSVMPTMWLGSQSGR